MTDKTENIRRAQRAVLDAAADGRAGLEAVYGQVWDTTELQQDFYVEGFMAPYVVVTRKADDVRGTLAFQGRPRFYFSFTPSR